MKSLNNSLKLLLLPFLLLGLSCVQQRHLKTVTFQVDINEINNVTGVGIRGGFTSPPWETTVPLTDSNGDGIFELQVSRETAVNRTEFKFVDQNGNFELEGQPNRALEFEYKPETLVYKTKFNDPNGKQIKQDL